MNEQSEQNIIYQETKEYAGTLRGKLLEVLETGNWYTITELTELVTNSIISQNSVSAALRSLRKPQHGGHNIIKRKTDDASLGMYEYHLVQPNDKSIKFFKN
ncbi:MAG: hypothetical protein WC306_03375 [Candidatus Paceibacterota bacterium]